MPSSIRLLAALGAAALAAAVPAQATTLFALSDSRGGQSLVQFNATQPGTVTGFAVHGATTQLDGLDFRPANGLLYGYTGGATGSIYLVDPRTGSTSLVSSASSGVAKPLGIDFNPTVDRLRVVGINGQNQRVTPGNGLTTVDGTLVYGAGGGVAHAIDAAYTNSDNNPATGTQLYYIDSALDILATTSNPNGGVLSAVGALGVNANDYTGFDIATDPQGRNTAYASIANGAFTGLFNINLSTGAASLIGNIGDFGNTSLYGLAVDQASVVPEPGSLLLAATGGLAVLGLARRRPRSAGRA